MNKEINKECREKLEKAVRHSLGLEEATILFLDKKFKDYDVPVEGIDLLEIFQSIGINSIQLKPFIRERSLSEKGRNFLRRAARYIEKAHHYARGCFCSLDYLADSPDLDTLAQHATMYDFLFLRECLDVYGEKELEPHHL